MLSRLSIFTVTVALIAFSAFAQPAHDPYLDIAGAEWNRYFNAGDYDSMMTLYAEDAIAFPPNAPTLNGYAAIKADFDQFRAAFIAHKELFVDEIQAGKDWAIERSHYKLTLSPTSGGEPIVETGRWIVSRKLVNHRWLIAWEIWNTDTPIK